MIVTPQRRAASHPRRRLAVVAACCAAALAAGLAAASPASADRNYTVRFTQNAQGDITGTGNTLMTCRDDDDKCAAARNGTASGADNNNNNRSVRYVDIDTDATTFDSSAATLALPAGARVLFAGLYYGGRLQAGTGGSPAPDQDLRGNVLLRPPGLGGYIRLTASQLDDTPTTGGQTARQYQGFVDVTDIVAAAGAGEYTVANVQLGTGLNADQDGGWALAVAYEDTNQPTRNLTIFDGFKFVLADGPPVDIPLSGFTTPRSGPVTTRIGLVALEGDLGTTGDSATLNAGTPQARVLTNATNPQNNFFNASISSRTGTSFTTKRPNHLNQLGFDADVFDATGFLSNGQTSTTLRLATSGDGFAPQGVSFATDLFAPAMRVTKAVAPTGSVEPGAVLTYTLGIQNTGLDAAIDTALRDAIPSGTTFVPGSLRITSGANAGAKTDAVGDDQAELDPAGAVVMRLGAGANATNGGRLAVNEATTVSFQVKVNDPLPPQFVVQNSASVGYTSETLGLAGSVSSPVVETPLIVPDLAIDKSHTGEFVAGRTVPFTLDVRNVGDATATGTTTVTDTLPAKMSFAGAASGDGWACTTSDKTLTCTRSDALAPGAAFPSISFRARIASDAAPAELVNTARVSNPHDGNELNDEDSDGGPSRDPVIDLAIDKVALTPLGFPGQPVRFLLRVANRGPDSATNVVVRDVLPPGLTPVSATPSRGTCSRTTCRLGRMRAGATATITITAVAGPNTGGQRLRDVAAVRGREHDIDLANNRDDAFVRIIPLVDIVVEKRAANPTPVVGTNVVFLVLVRNDGPSGATGVVLRDLLPPGLTPVSATPTQGTCPTPTSCALGSLARGETAQIVVVAGSDASLVNQTLTNTAAALAREPDVNLANNLARAPVTFQPVPPSPPADVVVTKTADAQTVTVGEQFDYTITARNRGPGTADSVVVTDTPSANETLISATPSQGTCAPAVPVRCELGSLAPGASATVTIRMRADAAGALRNGATAITPTPTVTPPGDQIAVEGTTAQSAPRVRLSKRASRRVVPSGGRVTFTLTATGAGRGTARDVTVCDRMPELLDVVDRGGARLRDGRWCWDIASLPSGSSRTLRITVRAGSVSQGRRVTNIAALTAGTQAPRFARAVVRIVPPRARLTG